MAILDILHDIAPQFTDDIKNQRYIDYASPQVSSTVYRDVYELAVAYLAAHMLQISTRDGSVVGGMSSISEGQRSISYATSTPQDSHYLSTSYGCEYLRLTKMYTNTILVTGASDVC